MRTFIKTATIASVAGVGLILAAAPAHADAPDDYDYASGTLGGSCAGYSVGHLALERSQGFVLSCNADGTWHIPTAP